MLRRRRRRRAGCVMMLYARRVDADGDASPRPAVHELPGALWGGDNRNMPG